MEFELINLAEVEPKRHPQPGPLPSGKLTWAQVKVASPALAQLHAKAKQVRDDKAKRSFCANWVWYSDFKPRLLRLVGWDAELAPGQPDWLYSTTAYDVAYQTIYAVLPDCRNCMCA